MDKQNVAMTQNMWKDYENTMFWLNTINNPQEHMIIKDNEVVDVSGDYKMALESLNYILTGNQNIPISFKRDK